MITLGFKHASLALLADDRNRGVEHVPSAIRSSDSFLMPKQETE